jgi:hypothetical protein
MLVASGLLFGSLYLLYFPNAWITNYIGQLLSMFGFIFAGNIILIYYV